MPTLSCGAPHHVLMTADAVGGVWQYATDLSLGLTAAGLRVTLAILGPSPDAGQRREATAAGVELVETGLAPDWLSADPAEAAATGRALAALAEERQADLLHLNHPASAPPEPPSVPVLAVCHSCLGSWWEAVRAGPMPGDFAWRSALMAAGLGRATAVAAPSAAFAETITRLYRPAPPPVAIANGRRAADGAMPATPRDIPVLTAGRLWDEGKNVAALDRAIGHIGITGLAAGPLEGPNGARVHLTHLRPLGRLEESALRRQMARALVFATAARYEPFGLTVLEAAQAGCALVLADIPTFRELWDDAATFVPTDDEAAIATAIDRLLASPARLRAQGRAARARAASFTPARMTAAYLDLYRTLVRAAAARARECAA